MRPIAYQFVQVLVARGVRRVYGVVGDRLNGLTDALRRQSSIEWVHIRHEETATGFPPCMVKAVLNGRADEIVDLARTNPCR